MKRQLSRFLNRSGVFSSLSIRRPPLALTGGAFGFESPPAAAVGLGAGAEPPPQPTKAKETDITAGMTVTNLRDFEVMEVDLIKLGIWKAGKVDPSLHARNGPTGRSTSSRSNRQNRDDMEVGGRPAESFFAVTANPVICTRLDFLIRHHRIRAVKPLQSKKSIDVLAPNPSVALFSLRGLKRLDSCKSKYYKMYG